MRVRKYLKKSCCHRIKCPADNFLAAFMWKRSLNSAALATITHRRPERVSDGTSTRVAAWMIDKCRIKIVWRELHNVKDPPWMGIENHKRNIVVIKNQLCNQTWNEYIRTDLLVLCRRWLFLIQLNLFPCSGQLGPLY